MVGGRETAQGGAEMEAVSSICEVRQVYASARREHSGLRSWAIVQLGIGNSESSVDHVGVSQVPVPLMVNWSVHDVYPVD